MNKNKNLFDKKIFDAIQRYPKKVGERLEFLLNIFNENFFLSKKDISPAQISFCSIEAAKNLDISKEDLFEKIQQSYFNFDNITENKNDQIEQSIKQEFDNMLENTSDVHIIDLIADIPQEELSFEGKRARGYLPRDFDSEKDSEKDYFIPEKEENLPVAIKSFDNDGNILILCPKCGSNALFVETTEGMCLDCNCDFIVKIDSCDILPNENETIEESKILDSNGNKIIRRKNNKE